MSKVNFKDKHLRYGGYGALLTIIVIAIAVVFNIVVTNLNLKVDTTHEKIYSLTATTKKVVKELKDPINVYVLEETNQETPWLKEILMKYNKLNNNVSIVYKDPVLYPTFGSNYLKKTTQNIQTMSPSTVIVENQTTGKFKIVPPTEFTDTSQQTSENGGNNGTSVTVENAITNAIGYVTNANDGLIFYTTGHNELALSSNLTECFNRSNLTSKSLNLLTEETPDPNNSAIIVNSPHSDFDQKEVDKLISYLEAGGKAMIFLDADITPLPNFDQVLSYYGVEAEKGIAIETDANNMLSQSPTILLPVRGDHQIVNTLSNKAAILFPIASGVKQVASPRDSLTLTSLFRTSDKAFLKTDLTTDTLTKQTGDIDGPIDLAYAIEDKATTTPNSTEDKPDYTKLLVFGNSFFISDKINLETTGNLNLMTNSLGWLLSMDTGYAIQGKTASINTIQTLSSIQMVLLELLVIIVIPLIIVITGIVVWVRRRHL